MHGKNGTDSYIALVGDGTPATGPHPFYFQMPDSGALVVRAHRSWGGDDDDDTLVKVYAPGVWRIITTAVAQEWPHGGLPPSDDELS